MARVRFRVLEVLLSDSKPLHVRVRVRGLFLIIVGSPDQDCQHPGGL